MGLFSGLVRLVLFRFFGARVLLALSVLGWLRNRLWPPRPASARSGRASSGGDVRR